MIQTSTSPTTPLDMYIFVIFVVIMLSFETILLGGKPVAALTYGGYAREMGEHLWPDSMEMRTMCFGRKGIERVSNGLGSGNVCPWIIF